MKKEKEKIKSELKAVSSSGEVTDSLYEQICSWLKPSADMAYFSPSVLLFIPADR